MKPYSAMLMRCAEEHCPVMARLLRAKILNQENGTLALVQLAYLAGLKRTGRKTKLT